MNANHQPNEVRIVPHFPRHSGGPKIRPDSLRQKCIRANMPYHVVYQRILWGWTEADALRIPRTGRLGRMPRAIRFPEDA